MVDREQAISAGDANRPDLKSAVQNLDVDDLSIQTARNALLPNSRLDRQLHRQRARRRILRGRTSSTTAYVPVLTSIPGGLGDAFSQMFGFGFSSLPVRRCT